MTASLELVKAFELSWQNLDEQAQRLSQLLSLFAPAPIDWKLVEACLSDRPSKDWEKVRDESLLGLHLLQRLGQGIYQLHPLLRQFFRAKLEHSDRNDELKRPVYRGLGVIARRIPVLRLVYRGVVGLLDREEGLKRRVCQVMVGIAGQIPDTPTREMILTATPLIVHLEEVATTLERWVEDEDLLWPYAGLGRFYEGQGAYAQALPWREQCLSVSRDRLGAEHPAVVTSLNNLAGLYESQGRYEEAEPLYLRALRILFARLGDNHPHTIVVRRNFVRLLETVIENGQTAILSDDPLTQEMLRQLEARPDQNEE